MFKKMSMKHCALIGWLEQCVVIGQALQVCFKSNTPTIYSTRPRPVFFFLHMLCVGII